MYKLLSLDRLKSIKLADLLNPQIVRFIWSAILDERVCDLCRSLDGKVMDVTSPDYSIYKSPLHPRCRCTQIPVTSDAEKIPTINWEKPKDDWIKKYAPFLFIIPTKKKEKIEEITPYIPEIPELVFNPKDIFSIEDYIAGLLLININDAKQRMVDMEKDMPRIIYIVFFLDKFGRVILEMESEKDIELDLTSSEEDLIKERAVYYLISDGNPVVETQIEDMFNIQKR